jgi:uncharacterized membrane protein YdbT with pleckstrin-like domain
MADERIVFRGNPSLVTIMGTVLLSALLFVGVAIGLFLGWRHLPESPLRFGLFGLFLVPLGILGVKWIGLKFLTYEITSERIKVTRGIFSRRTDELDTALIEPFHYRIFGVGNVLVVTHDAATPQIELRGIPGVRDVREQLRHSIEECRQRKGARVVEME